MDRKTYHGLVLGILIGGVTSVGTLAVLDTKAEQQPKQADFPVRQGDPFTCVRSTALEEANPGIEVFICGRFR